MIGLHVQSRIATVTLQHPPVNAISTEWLAFFESTLDALSLRTDWHVLHLRSLQKVFCAGADLAQIAARIRAADGPEQMLVFVAAIQRLFARIEALPQITIAEIGGAAMGGGLELGLACDLRIVALEAKLGLPEARLGLLPGAGGTQRLTRLCGAGVASRLILGTEIIDGGTAATLGIAQWALARNELPARALAIAQGVAEQPAAALAACKKCIAAAADPGRGGYADEMEYTRRLLTHAETRRRVEAFFSENLR
jgi:enoyl-CoA hydratase/carnithine racemase